MPSDSGKTDNASLAQKLELRRYFLKKYHADGSARVFDCCQASGAIWRAMRDETPIASYWGVDIKPKPGRITADSARILMNHNMPENVIDIDTYGSPWSHYANLLAGPPRSLTVFLTIGWGMGPMSSVSHEALDTLGLGRLIGKRVPNKLLHTIHTHSIPQLIYAAELRGWKVDEVQESVCSGHRNAKYFGVKLSARDAA